MRQALPGAGVSRRDKARGGQAVARQDRQGDLQIVGVSIVEGDRHGGVARSAGRSGTVKEGGGLWVSTEDFLAPHVRKRVRHVLPDASTLRYRFGDHTVTMRPVDGDPDRLEAEVRTEIG